MFVNQPLEFLVDSLAEREVVENACVGLGSVSQVTLLRYTWAELYLPQESSSKKQCMYILYPFTRSLSWQTLHATSFGGTDLGRPSAQFPHSGQKRLIVGFGGRSREIEVS